MCTYCNFLFEHPLLDESRGGSLLRALCPACTYIGARRASRTKTPKKRRDIDTGKSCIVFECQREPLATRGKLRRFRSMASPSESSARTAVRYVVGDIIAGKYRLEARLGEGGMGEVWHALNLQLDAPVALKLIRAGLDHELLGQRLKREARAAAKLGHPAIVRIFD